jgi:hypothetical protein
MRPGRRIVCVTHTPRARRASGLSFVVAHAHRRPLVAALAGLENSSRLRPPPLPRRPDGHVQPLPVQLDFMAMRTAARRDSYIVPTDLPAAAQSALHESDLVRVQCRWDDWRTAMVRPGDLDEVHWWWPAGAPRALIHAYVDCSQSGARELPHDCEPGSRPHRLLVCVLKSHVSSHVFEYFSQRARTCGPVIASSNRIGSAPAGV